MIGDFLYKLARKSLPRALYRAISWSPFGRSRDWHRLPSYAGHFAFYSGEGMDCKGRRVAEVGCGNQYYTAFFLLSRGAEEVVLVEPTWNPDAGKFEREWKEFSEARVGLPGLEETRKRIRPFLDLADVPAQYDGRVDLILSYLVLEHFRDLASFFRHTVRLLAAGGMCRNRVDLSDHTYHVFGKFPRLGPFSTRHALQHLRYSDRVYELVNDPKCWMNRRLVPEYRELAAAHGLSIRESDKSMLPESRFHPDLSRRHPAATAEDFRTYLVTLEFRKSGNSP